MPNFFRLAQVWAFLICTTSYYTNSQNVDADSFPSEASEPQEINYELCDIPFLGGDVAKEVPDNLLRMGPNSKYFILAGETMPIDEVSSFCKTYGLQPAEIRNKVELMSIAVFLKANAPENIVFSLGVNDKKDKGSYLEYDGTPMKFHSFAEGQPDNNMDAENCVQVSFHHTYEQLVYNDVDCQQGTTPVCMFKPSDYCFLGSPLTLARISQGFELVGSSTVRDYYVKLKQYPWTDAAAECAKSGLQLVDFSTGLSNNQVLYDLVKKWIGRNYLFEGIPFWTGGKLVSTDSGGMSGDSQYKFESSGKLLSDLSDWPSLAWDVDEPSDSSALDLETCISAILYSPYRATGDNVFTVSTTNCRIPQYPLCYQEKGMSDALNDIDADYEDGLGGRSTKRDPTAGRLCRMDVIAVDLSLPQVSDAELLKLAAANRNKPFDKSTNVFKWPADRDWLSKFTQIIFRAPKEVCPGLHVPEQFLNVMRNMLILYYTAINDKIEEPDARTKSYTIIQSAVIDKCLTDTQPMYFDSLGGVPKTFESHALTPVSELSDTEGLIPDLVIDTLWYSYQIAVATCYPIGYPSKTYWLQRVHNLFTTYFLEPLHDRWFSSNTSVKWGIIMGDVDIDAAYYGLKACALAAFYRSKIPELYFPRAVFLQTKQNDEEFNTKFQTLLDTKIAESDEFDMMR